MVSGPVFGQDPAHAAWIDDLLATPELEAWRVGPGDSLHHDADHVN